MLAEFPRFATGFNSLYADAVGCVAPVLEAADDAAGATSSDSFVALAAGSALERSIDTTGGSARLAGDWTGSVA